MTPASRSGLESAVLLVLLVAGVFAERARGALESLYLAFACLVLASLFARWLAVRGRAAPVEPALFLVELASFSGLVVFPFGRHGLVLAALATLGHVLRRPGDARATLLDELAVAGVAALASTLALDGRTSPPALALALPLAVEAWTPGASRLAGDAGRRFAAFALVLGLAWIRGHEKTVEGPLVEELLFFAAATAAAVTLARARPRLGPLPGLWLAATLAIFGLAHPDLGATYARGRGLAYLFLALDVLLFFFVLARALSAAERPDRLATVAATALTAFVAVEGGLLVKTGLGERREDLSLIHSWPSPLVAIAQPELVDPTGAPRRDWREHVFTPRKPAGVWRVVLLGGSTAWSAYQTSRETSLSGLLERRLQAVATPGTTVEVICLAFPGLTSDQELGLVVGHALGWEPDLLLAFDDYNDLVYLSGRDNYPGEMYCWPQHRRGLGWPFARQLVRSSRLAQPLVAGTDALGPPPFDEHRLALGGGNGFFLDGLAANEEAIAILAKDAGIAFAWAPIAVVYDLETRPPAACRREPYGSEVARRSTEARRRIAPVVAAHGAHVLDVPGRLARRHRLAPTESWFQDECHNTDRGVEVIAEELANELGARGLPPRGDR